MVVTPQSLALYISTVFVSFNYSTPIVLFFPSHFDILSAPLIGKMKRLLSLVLMGVLFQADAEFDRRIDGPRMMDDWVLSVDDFGAVGDGVSDDTQVYDVSVDSHSLSFNAYRRSIYIFWANSFNSHCSGV